MTGALTRRWRAAALAVCLTTLAARPALAHGHLRSSVPANGAVLSTAPSALRLTFTESPELAFTTVELLDPTGQPVALASVALIPDSSRVVVAAIRGPLVAGRYTVRWRTAAKDGHPTSGEFHFSIESGAAGLSVAPAKVAGQAASSPPAAGMSTRGDAVLEQRTGAFDVQSPGYVVVRWILFTAVLIVVGAVAFRFAVLPRVSGAEAVDAAWLADAGRRAAHAGYLAAIAALVASALRLAAQSFALDGAGDRWWPASLGDLLGHSVWGRVWVVSVVAAAGAALAFQRARGGSARAWAGAAAAAVTLAASLGLSGHAASSDRLPALAVVADSLHVIGASGWLGSLLLVVVAGLPAALAASAGPDAGERGVRVARLVQAYSPTALLFAGMVGVTGVFATWLHVASVPALWSTPYGRTLLVKLAVLSVVVATGAYNWLRLRPSLGGSDGPPRLRRSAAMELLVGVLVLLVTAVLVATPTAVEAAVAAR